MPDMDLKNIQKEDLVFDDSKKTNSRGESILGTFEGPCADIVDGTRNGRHYSEELWNKVFDDPIVKELFECGGILGELDHPSDREETKTSEVAICMSEPPVKGKDGLLYGKWDVLDTPNGRIAATLAKYGYKFGISSRGSGDTYTGPDGNEEVDPNSYDFQAFDLVILPAVKKARLTFKEGLERSSTLRQELTESLNKATPDERAIMENTLSRLNIDLTEDVGKQHESRVDNINEALNNTSVDNAEDSIVQELQEALNSKQKLENKVIALQEKLSACYTRESKQEQELNTYKKKLDTLIKTENKVKKLEESVSGLTGRLELVTNKFNSQKEIISSLNKRLEASMTNRNSLKESLSKNANTLKQLHEEYNQVLQEKETEIKTLEENYNELQKDSNIKKSEYSSKLDNANRLIEKYKKIANKAVDKYIESQALKLGVTKEEIKNKLPNSYSFSDIDSICENLQEYKLNMNRLPFRKLTENASAKVTRPKEDLPLPVNSQYDDNVDDSLLSLAGMR